MTGVHQISVSLLTNKALVHFDSNNINLRKIVDEISDIGFEAKVDVMAGKQDIREILEISVTRYRRKFLMSLLLFLPIFILIWIFPLVSPH